MFGSGWGKKSFASISPRQKPLYTNFQNVQHFNKLKWKLALLRLKSKSWISQKTNKLFKKTQAFQKKQASRKTNFSKNKQAFRKKTKTSFSKQKQALLKILNILKQALLAFIKSVNLARSKHIFLNGYKKLPRSFRGASAEFLICIDFPSAGKHKVKLFNLLQIFIMRHY